MSPVVPETIAVNCCFPPGPIVRYPLGPIVTVWAFSAPAANDAAKKASGAKDLPILCIWEKASSCLTCPLDFKLSKAGERDKNHVPRGSAGISGKITNYFG